MPLSPTSSEVKACQIDFSSSARSSITVERNPQFMLVFKVCFSSLLHLLNRSLFFSFSPTCLLANLHISCQLQCSSATHGQQLSATMYLNVLHSKERQLQTHYTRGCYIFTNFPLNRQILWYTFRVFLSEGISRVLCVRICARMCVCV